MAAERSQSVVGEFSGLGLTREAVVRAATSGTGNSRFSKLAESMSRAQRAFGPSVGLGDGLPSLADLTSGVDRALQAERVISIKDAFPSRPTSLGRAREVR